MGLNVATVNPTTLKITLNRPEFGNSLNFDLAKRIKEAFVLAEKKGFSLVVLEAEGKNFCTGADLSWMLRAKSLSSAQNRRDMKGIAEMYKAISKFSGIFIVKAQGKVLGGGLGLLASADISYCEPNTVFMLPEILLNITPGIITPVIIQRIGYKHFLQLAVSGKPISLKKAVQIGLADFAGNRKVIDKKIEETVLNISSKNGHVIREIKRMASLVRTSNLELLNRFSDVNSRLRVRREFIEEAEKKIK